MSAVGRKKAVEFHPGSKEDVERLIEQRRLEIRWHGRGGQGVVTASRILAESALAVGLYAQSLPDFGAERSGAPLAVYTRVGRHPFYERGHVINPDIVVVIDPTLLGKVNVLAGITEGGVLLVNTEMSPSELAKHLPGDYGVVCTLDASSIAMNTLQRKIPNIPMLGALVRVLPLVPLEEIERTIRRLFMQKFGERIVELNLKALEMGYREVKWEELL